MCKENTSYEMVPILKVIYVDTVKLVLSDHLKQDIFLAFRTDCCLLFHGIMHYFHSAISHHLSKAISKSPEWRSIKG